MIRARLRSRMRDLGYCSTAARKAARAIIGWSGFFPLPHPRGAGSDRHSLKSVSPLSQGIDVDCATLGTFVAPQGFEHDAPLSAVEL